MSQPSHPAAYEADDELRVGVVGYSATPFDEREATDKLSDAMNEVTEGHDGPVAVVSGLTRLGIPKLAYDLAERRDDDPTRPAHTTVGIACRKAEDFECHDVDTRIVDEEWNEWGDESPAFLSSIDAVVRVGGGDQALAEVEEAKEFLDDDAVVERELEALSEEEARRRNEADGHERG